MRLVDGKKGTSFDRHFCCPSPILDFKLRVKLSATLPVGYMAQRIPLLTLQLLFNSVHSHGTVDEVLIKNYSCVLALPVDCQSTDWATIKRMMEDVSRHLRVSFSFSALFVGIPSRMGEDSMGEESKHRLVVAAEVAAFHIS